MSLIEKMILEKFRELPALPEGYYYDYGIEYNYNGETQSWEFVVTATPVRRPSIMIRDINGKETIID